MSAYIVEPKTINRILSFFHYAKIGGDAHFRHAADMAARELSEIEFDIEQAENLPDLGQAMHNLNVNAVSQRYPHDVPDNLPGCSVDGYEFRQAEFIDPVQALKSLQCWLYQCSEGNAVETGLFKAWREAERHLTDGIVSKLPQYDAAEWG